MVVFGERSYQSGSVELHFTTGGWRDHGHHRDPAYDDVILHVVRRDDGAETRTSLGKIVPLVVVEIDDREIAPYEGRVAAWDRVGGTVCAEELTRTQPQRLRTLLWQLGDLRLAAKAARFEAQLTDETPGEVLYRALFDGLGFSRNREPMARLAALLPLERLNSALNQAPSNRRGSTALASLLGAAGFLPLSPSDAAIAHLRPEAVIEIERCWTSAGFDSTLTPSAWNRARVRPGNHPLARLVAAAALLANARNGLVSALLALLEPGSDPIDGLRALCQRDERDQIGRDRATGLVINALIPFAFALAESNGDLELADRAAAAWERIPAAESTEIDRRALAQVAGEARLTKLGGRGQQGLIHLDTTLCRPRRCFECPVAHAVLDQK
jgi:hypothetical protein